MKVRFLAPRAIREGGKRTFFILPNPRETIGALRKYHSEESKAKKLDSLCRVRRGRLPLGLEAPLWVRAC